MLSGDRIIQIRGPTIPVGNEVWRVSHCNGGPEGLEFSGSHVTPMMDYFARILFGDVLYNICW